MLKTDNLSNSYTIMTLKKKNTTYVLKFKLVICEKQLNNENLIHTKNTQKRLSIIRKDLPILKITELISYKYEFKYRYEMKFRFEE